MRNRSDYTSTVTGLVRAARKSLPVLALLGVSAVTLGLAFQGNSQTQAACQSNLKQMSLGMLMYLQDYDEQFPATKTAAQTQNRILPYVRDRKTFSCPETGAAYLPNPALSQTTLAALKAPASTMMLRDAKPHKTASGKPGWNIAYVDGHVKLSMKEVPLGKPAPEPKRARHSRKRK